MKKQKGFSLIELLIVVGIIGALTAIAVPVYTDYKNKSDVTAAIASVKTLLSSADLHLQTSSAKTLQTFITDTQANGGLGGTAADGYKIGALGSIKSPADSDQLVFTFADGTFQNETITFERGAVIWSCEVSNTIGTTVTDIESCSVAAGT